MAVGLVEDALEAPPLEDRAEVEDRAGGVVTRLRRRVVTSSSAWPGARWIRMAALFARPPAVGAVTSVLVAALGRSFQSAAAAAWLSAAPAPVAMTPAIQRPSRLSTGSTTA